MKTRPCRHFCFLGVFAMQFTPEELEVIKRKYLEQLSAGIASYGTVSHRVQMIPLKEMREELAQLDASNAPKFRQVVPRGLG